MGLNIHITGAALALISLCVPAAAQNNPQVLPPIDVFSSRLGAGIAGTSTSVITAEDIERSPGELLQDVISRQAGIQTWSTAGGINGATTVVDMRGFGAAATSNTLVLRERAAIE